MKYLAVISFLILILLFTTPSTLAQWPTSPDQRLYIGYGIHNLIVSDGEGGAFVVYRNNPEGFNHQCYLQKLDSFGYPLFWQPLHLDTGGGYYVPHFNAVTDGQGGVIIALLERCVIAGDSTKRLIAFRFDQDGIPLWGAQGIQVNGENPPGESEFPLSADSSGGAYFLWLGGGFHVQHVGANGDLQWGPEGIVLGYIQPPQTLDMNLCSTVEACWATVKTDTLRAFKLSPQGQHLWSEDGVVMPDLGYERKMAPDGVGGVVQICKQYILPSGARLISYRLDQNGEWVWGDEGLDLGWQFWDKNILSYDGFIYYGWDSYDPQSTVFSVAQKTDLQGEIQWFENGVYLNQNADGQNSTRMAEANSTGILFVWADYRDSCTFNFFAQKLSYSGEELWDIDDIRISDGNLTKGAPHMDNNGSGGCIVSWFEIDPIYSQRICAAMVNAEGELGVVSGIDEKQNPPFPGRITLLPAFPNPFNSSTVLSFQLQVAGMVKLDVFDINGRTVGARHAVPLQKGWYTFDGSGLASGIYLARLQAGSYQATEKLVLLK